MSGWPPGRVALADADGAPRRSAASGWVTRVLADRVSQTLSNVRQHLSQVISFPRPGGIKQTSFYTAVSEPLNVVIVDLPTSKETLVSSENDHQDESIGFTNRVGCRRLHEMMAPLTDRYSSALLSPHDSSSAAARHRHECASRQVSASASARMSHDTAVAAHAEKQCHGLAGNAV